ncbi:hypothetical protein C8A05DRAFT_39978 [Staphylotrichum tortipilum]|uniref:Uncharacterized protein n=1 Tax=Staphylotrichum tortipilum TaxID=2831512 RepID=A0AAN6M9Q7_9PEZI|nr:hypothetical protein C8A05DRAFT_39978 [Staphylotrichum longicolle]
MPLLDLPDELLLRIARHAGPGWLEENFTLWTAASQSRLLSLTKTNRRLNAIATPLLYRIVSICSPRLLFGLLRTFLQSPHLATHVRTIRLASYLVPPPVPPSPVDSQPELDDDSERDDSELSDTSHPDSREPLKNDDSASVPDKRVYLDDELQGLLARIPPGATLHRHLALCFGPPLDQEDPRRLVSAANEDQLVESSCALVLCLTVNVLTLNLALHCVHQPRVAHAPLLHVFQGAHADPALRFLPFLSHLHLVADSEDETPTPDEISQAYMAAGRVTNLELDSVNLEQQETGWDPRIWRDLERIDAADTFTGGAWWYRLCSEARPGLRQIQIYPWLASNDAEDDEDAPGPGLNDALRLCADTLTELSVTLVDQPAYMAQLGPDRCLSCLRSMRVLVHLELSASLLFESPDAMWRGDICNALPPSLTTLHLQENSGYEPWGGAILDDRFGNWKVNDLDELDDRSASQHHPDNPLPMPHQYAVLLRRALLQLALNSSDRLPRLETVCITRDAMEHWPAWGPELAAISTISLKDNRRKDWRSLASRLLELLEL